MDEAWKEKEAFFETLHHQYYKKLLRHANAYFRFKKQFFHLAENAVQETFCIAFEAYHSFSVHPKQEAWLYVVLRRRLYAYMQEVISNQAHLLPLDEGQLAEAQEDEADEVETFLQNEANRDLVRRLMGRLSEKEKSMLYMFYYEEKSAAEIAALHDTSDRVVNTQLYRIRKKMKKIFESGIFLLICRIFFHI